MKTASEAADPLNVLISEPGQASRQAHRQNYGIQFPEEYYRVAIYVPHMNSLTAFLARRFSEHNVKSVQLLQLHLAKMKYLSCVEFHAIADELPAFYSIENLKKEGISWYEIWRNETADSSKYLTPNFCLRPSHCFQSKQKQWR
ncbi:hypothetical protein HPB48_000440 [Haemaphysalis longicornis]|uniref:Uncharacterized protein n=1 Tax=Haemaphysalis longicornis TaxID=44386 RepID=A0A9J6F963_HAELO|nr:hypothetical protein HPB48_000440 [Haemaphysalis longicornis]